jgi:hypothetical protein
MMKIFGYEAAFKAASTEVTRIEFDELLDAMHASLVQDNRIYSADIVGEGVGELAVLLGVQVEENESMDDAQGYGERAIQAAFQAAGAQARTSMSATSRSVRELVAAC